MDIIKMARELGAAIQKSDEYIAHKVAREAADNDQNLQKMIGDFNIKKISLSQEIQKGEGKDDEKIASLNTQVREMYDEIMRIPTMMAYNTTKEEMDKTLNFIQQIIVYSANGEDPNTIEDQPECTGSCSSCSGCH